MRTASVRNTDENMEMDAAVRLLRLLSLLQARPAWTGGDLAERLAVTPRTVRRDIARLRDLGYPVDAMPGVEGGYRLGTGGRLPPLLLDDDEAVAIVVGLRVAATTTVSGVESAAVAALAKLEPLLPAPVRERVAALQASTTQLRGPELPQIDADVLVTLATACRRSETVSFAYRDHDGRESERRVEPLQIVHTGRRWYLVARDRSHGEWRTFRVDRIQVPALTGHRATITDPPDAARLVSEGTTIAPYRVEARILLHVGSTDARRFVPPTIGVVEAQSSRRSLLRIAANDVEMIARHMCFLPCEFEVLDPPDLRARIAEIGARAVRSTGAGEPSERPAGQDGSVPRMETKDTISPG
jgi:predicted DNA-binding transcriptional regulator YafY